MVATVRVCFLVQEAIKIKMAAKNFAVKIRSFKRNSDACFFDADTADFYDFL
jgi:hypothetical protein